MNITEMNLAGAVPLKEMLAKGEFTKWRTADESENPIPAPRDHLFEHEANQTLA